MRQAAPVFDADADFWTVGAGNDAVLTLGRYKDGEKLYGLYNFSPEPQTAWLAEPGPYRDLRTGAEVNTYGAVTLEGYGFLWLLKRM